VAELQEILGKGQSQISTSLAQIEAGRIGGRPPHREECLLPVASARRADEPAAPGSARDCRGGARPRRARHALRKRQDKMRRYFDELAGRFGRQYVPGRSWKGIAEGFSS